jgi:integrase
MAPIPFPQFIDGIIRVYAVSHAPRTTAKMLRILKSVQAIPGVDTTADLTTETVARFVAARMATTICVNTVIGDLSYVAAACTMAVEEGWLDRPPRFRRVRPRAASPKNPRAHSIADVRRLLELLESRASTWSGARLHAVAAAVAYTGMRRDEALTLQQSDVNVSTGLITIVARRRLKTAASAAPVPIPPELRPILHTWLPKTGCAWCFPGVRLRGPWLGGANGTRACDQIRRAGLELGIEGLTLLSLRHTFATHCRRQWGLSSLELADVLRHTSPATQRWYVHGPELAALVASVDRVSYRHASASISSDHESDADRCPKLLGPAGPFRP